ncbi:hypothetical protein ACFX12_022701 [Malus domestica]
MRWNRINVVNKQTSASVSSSPHRHSEPPVPQLLTIDTGSNLLCLQCLPCTKCFEQTSPTLPSPHHTPHYHAHPHIAQFPLVTNVTPQTIANSLTNTLMASK